MVSTNTNNGGNLLHSESLVKKLISFLGKSDIIMIQAVSKKVLSTMQLARKDRKLYFDTDMISLTMLLEIDGDHLRKVKDCTYFDNYFKGKNVQVGTDFYIFATQRLPMTVTKYSGLAKHPATWKREKIAELESIEEIGSDNFSVVNFANQMIVLTGGETIHGLNVAKTRAFNLLTNDWEELPDLTESRSSHISLALGKCVYVFGGMRDSEDMDSAFNTFECLNLGSKLGYG